MAKLVIECKKQNKLIEEAFEEMAKVSRWKAMQVKFYTAMYKSKLNSLFFMLRNRVKSWVVEESKEHFKAVEEGDLEYIRLQKKKFENFMFGTEKKLKKDKDYQAFKNDRLVKQVIRKMKRGIIRSKDWAIEKALGEGRVLDFFLRSGISVVWRIEENGD